VKLTETEQKISIYIAKKRYQNARSKGITNNKKGPQSNYETDLEGVASEMAAAKTLNLWPDLQIEKIPEHDLKFGPFTIDVKTTKYKTGKLIAAKHKIEKSCDYYMLMIGSFPEYSCAGFCKKENLLNNNTLANLGWGELHAVDQINLQPLEDFLNENKT
jgi:hypothetical protein